MGSVKNVRISSYEEELLGSWNYGNASYGDVCF